MASTAVFRHPFATPVHGGGSTSSGAGGRHTGWLALLHEDDPNLQAHALVKLHDVVDAHWAEVAEAVTQIEMLAEDTAFPAHGLAALIASKIYYHLEAYSEAVRCALAAGDQFNTATPTPYVDTIISRCIDEYTTARQAVGVDAAGNLPPTAPAMDARLENVVNRMFERCWGEGSWRQALGIALEARRLDAVVETMRRGIAKAQEARGPHAMADEEGSELPPGASLLGYAVELVSGGPTTVGVGGGTGMGAATMVSSLPKAWRTTVLQALRQFYTYLAPDATTGALVLVSGGGAGAPSVTDYGGYGRLLQALQDTEGYINLLCNLIKQASTVEGEGVPDAAIMAFQLAADAVEADNQSFLLALHSAAAAAAAAAAPVAGDAATGDAATGSPATPPSAAWWSRLLAILDGSLAAAVHMDFLSHTCAADPLILKNTKGSVDSKNSVLHNAIVTAHGYMYSGTSMDAFLRTNLEWLGKASNWNKFAACASQGVVHKGRLGDSMRVLEAYLPRVGEATADAYAEGGALYALGLIHANRGAAAAAGVSTRPVDQLSASVVAGGGGSGGSDAVSYLHSQLRDTRNDVIQHGACLGLGTAAMGTGDASLFATMREVLFQESAVAGEGAALGIGLLLAGQGPSWRSEVEEDTAAREMLTQAHDTEHDKTIRGIAMALALMCYGLEDGADVLIGQLVRDKDALLRYGGMFAIGLAYAGTGSNGAVRQLLHVAVSDVSDDVRRAAVMSLGFVLCRQWREVPTLVTQLAVSYNPHVRYGAAMAVGIACAGSGLPDAVGLLEPLVEDGTDFVRQGALMALALVLQQESGDHLPRVTVVRERMAKFISDRHTPTMTRMGAIMAQGIIDMGGRNCITTMVSRSGFLKMSSVVGVALWLQHWYWYPLAHFLSLASTPTILVGMTPDFRIPTTWCVECKCKPTWFAYPPALVEKKEDKAATVTTVELSTAAKAKAKAAAKEKAKASTGGGVGAGGGEGDVNMVPSATPAPSIDGAATATGGAGSGASTEAGAPSPAATPAGVGVAPASFHLTNPSRVTLSQAKFLDFASVHAHRFQPVRVPHAGRLTSGIVFLKDTAPASEAAGGGDKTVRSLRGPAGGDEGAMAPTPEAFEWVIGDYVA